MASRLQISEDGPLFGPERRVVQFDSTSVCRLVRFTPGSSRSRFEGGPWGPKL